MKTCVLISALTLTALAINQPTVAQAQDDGSGNLCVELVDGTLFILGDQEPNKIIVSQFQDSEGVEQIVVGGDGAAPWELLPWIPYDWTSYTTVNGGGAVLYDASDVSEVVLIASGGDDQILLHGGLGPDILIDSGAGMDRVDSINTVIVGDLYVNTGKDRDVIVFSGTNVGGNTEFSTGHGSDLVNLGRNLFLGDLTINMGVHGDTLATVFSGGSIVGNLLVEMGQGDDTILEVRSSDPPEFAIGGFATFDGGQGLDSFDPSEITDLEGNLIASSRFMRLNFELP